MEKTLVEETYEYLAEGKYALAEQAAERLLLQEPEQVQGLCLLASIGIESGQPEKAAAAGCRSCRSCGGPGR